jgi:dephospho-CoA kinase
VSEDAATRIPVIGLVGGIGSGKSAVARILADLGCVVADSDALAREAIRDPAIVAAIRERWGQAVFDDAGSVDRSALAARVFSDPDERRRLEELIHPWVERRRRAIFAAAPPGTPAAVIDAPLLMEAGVDRECDHIIFVDAPRALRLERLRQARGWDEAELSRREAAQMPLDQKRRRADSIVTNDADPASLRERVVQIFDEIIRRRS